MSKFAALNNAMKYNPNNLLISNKSRLIFIIIFYYVCYYFFFRTPKVMQNYLIQVCRKLYMVPIS